MHGWILHMSIVDCCDNLAKRQQTNTGMVCSIKFLYVLYDAPNLGITIAYHTHQILQSFYTTCLSSYNWELKQTMPVFTQKSLLMAHPHLYPFWILNYGWSNGVQLLKSSRETACKIKPRRKFNWIKSRSHQLCTNF